MKNELTINGMQNLLGKNMDSFINLFFYKPIQLQEGWQMVLNSSKFKNIGDCTLIQEKDNKDNLTIYSCELYIGDRKGTIENPFGYVLAFIQNVFGANYAGWGKINKDGKSFEITIVHINE
jgi:hypothetical protein